MKKRHQRRRANIALDIRKPVAFPPVLQFWHNKVQACCYVEKVRRKKGMPSRRNTDKKQVRGMEKDTGSVSECG